MKDVKKVLFDMDRNLPSFVLEDDRIMVPHEQPTGSCWALSWVPEKKEDIKRIVFLNTAILTSTGSFRYKIETLSKLIHLISSYPEVEKLSAIGHQSTSDILTELFGFSIPLNRIQYRQEKGDYCVVFKLNGRPEEGKILTREDIEKIGYEFYILTKE